MYTYKGKKNYFKIVARRLLRHHGANELSALSKSTSSQLSKFTIYRQSFAACLKLESLRNLLAD